MEKYTKEIETERLILRKFKVNDANDIFNNYASHSCVTKYLTWSPHETIDDTINYLNNCVLPLYDEDYTYRWAIELKENRQVIGCIDVVGKNIDKQRAELGYVLGEKFWGMGIMPEAAKAVIDFLFSENFIRIQAIHDVDNPKSGRVMQKIGMSYEGTLKKYARNSAGQLKDCKMYSIIKNDD